MVCVGVGAVGGPVTDPSCGVNRETFNQKTALARCGIPYSRTVEHRYVTLSGVLAVCFAKL